MLPITRPALRYFGGKWRLAPWVIEHFPPHRIYVEPFGGGASVLLRKPRAWAEIYGDLDDEIVNVFRAIRDNCNELKRLLSATPFARSEFDLAHEFSEDPLERARRTIIRSFMGHGADSVTRIHKGGFRANSNHENQGRNAAHDWINYLPALNAIQQRMMGVILENREATQVMQVQDSTDTLHFVDPPYVWAVRSDKRHCYRHEMDDDQHASLCDFLKTLKGMVVLCGYENPIYDRLGWEVRHREALADGARERIEALWLNPAAIRAQAQQRFL